MTIDYLGCGDGLADMARTLADFFELLFEGAAVGFSAYDGSVSYRSDAVGTVEIRSPRAARYLVTAPGALGLARAYVMGDLEIHGDLHATLHNLLAHRRRSVPWGEVLRLAEPWMLRRPPIPSEEARAPWRRGLARHSKARDAHAISHHYDVSNRFYELVLGSSMAYSCAVFTTPGTGLQEAQREKFDLICRKLDLKPGERLLDIGAGWGGLVRHAARHYGVRALGVTLSREQADWARRAIAEAGLYHRADVRYLDYRDLAATGFDAISSGPCPSTQRHPSQIEETGRKLSREPGRRVGRTDERLKRHPRGSGVQAGGDGDGALVIGADAPLIGP